MPGHRRRSRPHSQGNPRGPQGSRRGRCGALRRGCLAQPSGRRASDCWRDPSRRGNLPSAFEPDRDAIRPEGMTGSIAGDRPERGRRRERAPLRVRKAGPYALPPNSSGASRAPPRGSCGHRRTRCGFARDRGAAFEPDRTAGGRRDPPAVIGSTDRGSILPGSPTATC